MTTSEELEKSLSCSKACRRLSESASGRSYLNFRKTYTFLFSLMLNQSHLMFFQNCSHKKKGEENKTSFRKWESLMYVLL